MNITNPNPHVDNMLSQTRNQQLALSEIVDKKANMILAVSSGVITISLANLGKPSFRWTALTLILCCLVSMALAAYATMPKLSFHRKKGARPDVDSSKFNILYFDDFLKLDYPAFQQRMEQLLNDTNLAYEAQVRELYTAGQYMAYRKYRFVRFAFVSLTTGFICAAIVFLITDGWAGL